MVPAPRSSRLDPVARVRCSGCSELFLPSPRLKARQKTCGATACRKGHRARYRRSYRKKNTDAEAGYREKAKAAKVPSFWKEYREAHRESAERNRKQTLIRKRLKHNGLQRQLDIAQVFVPEGYFEQYQGFATSHRSIIEEHLGRKAAA
jgi:hypothetical protein